MNGDVYIDGQHIATDVDITVGQPSREEILLERFRKDPVGFIREIFPNAPVLDEWQVYSLRMMAKNPRTKIVRTESGDYAIEVVDGWTVADPTISHDVERVDVLSRNNQTYIDPIHRQRVRGMFPIDPPDYGEAATCKPSDNSRQAFAGIAKRSRNNRTKRGRRR